jgi:hypothetical protein
VGLVYRPLLAAAIVLAAVLIPAGATSAPNVTLTGIVGPGFSITLKNPDGSKVTHLDPGAYTINVTDNETMHNFKLSGPGVDMKTDLEGTENTTWEVTFVDGTYNYICEAHPLQMKGSFTVGAVQPPPPPPAKLNGKVTSKTISLRTSAGATVRSVIAGAYKVVASDTSKTQNFHLTGPGVNKKTTAKFRGKKTWTVALSSGKYVYKSDKSKKLKRTFLVRDA